MKDVVKTTPDGDMFWKLNGKLHRTGGLPAVKYANGGEEYWENGIRITKEEALKRAAPQPMSVLKYVASKLKTITSLMGNWRCK